MNQCCMRFMEEMTMDNQDIWEEYREYAAPVVQFNKRVFCDGQGSFVIDADGNRFLDMSGGQFCAVLGHGNPEVAEKAFSLSQKIVNAGVGFLCDEVLYAAKAVHDICSGMNGRVFFLSTGAEANECCLRYAKQMSGHRSGVISFDVGYHGLSLGTEGYSMGRQYVKPQLKNSYFIKAPVIYDRENAEETDWRSSVEEMEQILRLHHMEIAAAIFEPIVSTGGLLYPPKEFWEAVRDLCDTYHIFLVFDECQTGFGRTDTWFYYQQLGRCIPDFLVCAKGMGLGYPAAMVVFNGNTIHGSDFVMNHVSSHQNDPFGAGLVRFGIQQIDECGYLAGNDRKGRYILEQIRQISREAPMVRNPRMCGLMGGFDLDFQCSGKKEILEKSSEFVETGLEHGLLLQFGNYGRTVRLLPPYSISYDEIDYFIMQLKATVSQFYKR